MPKTRKTTAGKPPRNPRDASRETVEGAERDPFAFRNMIAAMTWQPALRFALAIDGAPARCPRRVCQMDGQCHLTTAGAPPLSCGGGLSDETMLRAAQMSVFACAAVDNFVDLLVQALPQIADGVCKMIDELDPKVRQEIADALAEAASGDARR